MTAEPPEPRPLTDEDLDRIQATATRMVGFAGLGGREQPLTWDQVRHWDAVSAEDGLSLVADVRRLRADALELVTAVEHAATLLTTTDRSRTEVAAWLTRRIEGKHRMVVDGHAAGRRPGQDQQADDMAAIPDLVDVTGVQVLARYIVQLAFDDGTAAVIDLEPYLWGEMFAPLVADYELFCQVAVDPQAGTIVWPNGADLSPRMLYANAKAATPA